MTIENSLERIATALETLIGLNGGPQSTSTPAAAAAAAAKAPRKQRAVTEQKEAATPPEQSKESFDESAPSTSEAGGFDDEPSTAAAVEQLPTKEEMIAALTALGTVVGTDEARKLMAKYGNNAAKASEVPESKRADVIKQANDAKAKAEKAKAAKK